MKAKAVVFPEAESFETRELNLEAMRPGDVCVRTLVSAISPGTERGILKGKHIGTRFPCVPGYHRIGIVEKTGKEVTGLNEGDIVYGGSSRWQEKVYSMWGAHCSYSVGSASNHIFISSSMPDAVELETTVFTIAAAVAHRGIRVLDVQGGEKVLIIGAGFIGLCAAQLAMLKGAVPVFIEKDEARVGFAKKLGFHAFNPQDSIFEKELKEVVAEGVDIIYDSAGVPAAIDSAVGYAKRWSKLLLQAQYFDREHRTIDLDRIKIKEITVKTTCGTDDEDWDTTFANIKKRRLKIAPLITHRFPGEECLKGYDMLLKGKPFNLGMVFFWDRALLEKHPDNKYRRK